MVQSLKIILLFILRAIKIKSSDSVALGVQIKVRRSSVLSFLKICIFEFINYGSSIKIQNNVQWCSKDPKFQIWNLSHRSLLWSMLFTLSVVSVRLSSATAKFQPSPVVFGIRSVFDPKTSENKTNWEKLDKRNRRNEAISWADSRNAFHSFQKGKFCQNTPKTRTLTNAIKWVLWLRWSFYLAGMISQMKVEVLLIEKSFVEFYFDFFIENSKTSNQTHFHG